MYKYFDEKFLKIFFLKIFTVSYEKKKLKTVRSMRIKT